MKNALCLSEQKDKKNSFVLFREKKNGTFFSLCRLFIGLKRTRTHVLSPESLRKNNAKSEKYTDINITGKGRKQKKID